jgi:hypothetical protein
MFGGRIFQQQVGIPMGTNCAPLLADLFLYLYEADFIQGLLKKNEKRTFWQNQSGFFYQNKICPFLAQGICIYVGHSFL